jgi:16S rRNA (guanine1207-N2)-methyltransferase
MYPVMSLSNPSQLLLRNINLLAAKKPLFVNAPADNLISDYIKHYPQAKISCLNYNFHEYLFLKKQNNNQVDCTFSASYQSENIHDLIVIFFPKSKQELTYTLAMLASTIADKATVLLVGENKGGIKSALKLTDNLLSYGKKIDSARHCSLFSGLYNKTTNTFCLDDCFSQYQFTLQNIAMTIAALPGVFSQKKLDAGTQLLLNNLPKNMTGKVLDFGCGAGVISAFIGKKFPRAQLSLLDINALALESAKKTLQLNQLSGNVFASDGLSQVNEKYQHVVSNPPFHQGIKTNYSATESFLIQIDKFMVANADITLVANNFLHYQEIINKHLAKSTVKAAENGFCVYYAQKN